MAMKKMDKNNIRLKFNNESLNTNSYIYYSDKTHYFYLFILTLANSTSLSFSFIFAVSDLIFSSAASARLW